jgi:hypothetical protein
MLSFLRFGVAALVVGGFLTVSSEASADQITLTLQNSGTTVPTFTFDGKSESVNGGPFHWTQTTPVNANYATSVTTYCIDLTHEISQGGTYTYTASTNLLTAGTSITTTKQANLITTLFSQDYTQSLANSTAQAAFQLALWKLLYDGGTNLSLSSGNVESSTAAGSVGAAAQTLLNDLSTPSSTNDLSGSHLVVLISTSGNQNQILVDPNPPVAGVPAPPALMLAGIGIVALVGGVRWTRRAAA